MIAGAEDCRLDLSRPVIRASFASDLGLSDSDFADFVAFLADQEQCGLIHYEGGVVTTDRTQEDYVRVAKKRQDDRIRARTQNRGENGQFASENGDFATGSTAEQIRAEQSREDIDDDEAPSPGPESAGPSLAACLRRSAPRGLTLSDQLLAELRGRLEAEALDVGYVRWWGDYVRRQSNLTNPGGYFRVHFGERAEEYRVALLRQERRQAPDPGERATLEDIEAANARLPPEVRRHVAAACKAGTKTDRPRDGPLPPF